MIRPVTCVCMLLAAGSGLYLYQTKHRSQLLDQQITGILNNADANRERIRVLRAEYQLLQDPSRLGDLASQHLTLAKTDPKQFVTWATLERNFPVVIAPPPPVAPPLADPTAVAEPETPVAALVGPPAPLTSSPATSSPATSSPVVQQAAAARADAPPPRAMSLPAAPAPAQLAARVAPAAAPPRTPTPSAAYQTALTASAPPPPRSALGMARAEPGWANTAPRSVVATPQTAMATQRRYPYQAPQFGGTDAVARIARAAVADPATAPVGSALGMARALSASSYLSPASAAGWISNGGG